MLSSSVVSALFGAFILYTKELQVHPMRILMYCAFAESIFQATIMISPYTC